VKSFASSFENWENGKQRAEQTAAKEKEQSRLRHSRFFLCLYTYRYIYIYIYIYICMWVYLLEERCKHDEDTRYGFDDLICSLQSTVEIFIVVSTSFDKTIFHYPFSKCALQVKMLPPWWLQRAALDSWITKAPFWRGFIRFTPTLFKEGSCYEIWWNMK